jgi:DNA-binding NarL/FixJ family response regulator
MIIDAKSTDEIASALNVSRKTAANYHYGIKSKLGVASDIELFHFGLQHGLVDTTRLQSHPRTRRERSEAAGE